jgi:hypothetical protein
MAKKPTVKRRRANRGSRTRTLRNIITGMTCETAANVLESLGCSSDPVIHKGHATCPEEIGNEHSNDLASRMRIHFYTGTCQKPKYGTLLMMLKYRFNDAIKGRV